MKTWGVVGAVLLLGGCASYQAQQRTEKAAAKVHNLVNTVETTTEERMGDVPFYARVNELWVSERTTTRSPSEFLPPQFNRQVVFRSVTPVTFSQFITFLQQGSRTNVTVNGGDMSLLAPSIAVNYEGSLRGFVHHAAQRFGVGYGWTEGGLEITISETRTFPVMRPAVDVRTAAAGTGNAQRRDPYLELESAIKVLSPSARVVSSRSTNSITVVDRPMKMREIERYMAFDAQQAQRQVMLRWQMISYTSTLTGEAGAALNLLMSRGGKDVALTGGANASASANTLKLSITDPKSTLSGSSLVLALLNQNGEASITRQGVITLQNNTSKDYAQTKLRSFPSETQLIAAPGLNPNGANAALIPVTKLQPTEVGLKMHVSATIHPSEEVDGSMEVEMQELEGIDDFSTPLYQQKSGRFAKRLLNGLFRLRHGETQLFVMDNADSSSFDSSTGLGAKTSGNGQKEQWLMLITPIVTRGGT